MTLDEVQPSRPCSRSSSVSICRKFVQASTPTEPESASEAIPSQEGGSVDHDAASMSTFDGLNGDGVEAWAAVDTIVSMGGMPDDIDPFLALAVDARPAQVMSQSTRTQEQQCKRGPGVLTRTARPVQQWVRSLRRRGACRYSTTDNDAGIVSGPQDHGCEAEKLVRPGHKRSGSGSSSAFVTGVKSASISLASVSAMVRSRRNTGRSSRYTRTDHSSMASVTGPRLSTDSTFLENTMAMDRAVVERSLKRRRILEELVGTEEGYIGDIKFLMSVSPVAMARFSYQAPDKYSLNLRPTSASWQHCLHFPWVFARPSIGTWQR